MHPYHEIVYYLDGNADFCTETFQEKQGRGTLVFIPKETYHQFRYRNPECYTRLVMYFPDTVIDSLPLISSVQIKIFKQINSHILHILQRLGRKPIKDGASPTHVPFLCGYTDYSSFYKAYYKMFGHSPARDKV